MYIKIISTVAVLIAGLSLAVQLNLLDPVQPAEDPEWPSLLYQVRSEAHKGQNSALYVSSWSNLWSMGGSGAKV